VIKSNHQETTLLAVQDHMPLNKN